MPEVSDNEYGYAVLVDLPDTAAFLTLEEQSFVVRRKSKFTSSVRPSVRLTDTRKEYDNSSVGEEEHFELRHVKEAFLDWQVWALSLINMTILTAGTYCSVGI